MFELTEDRRRAWQWGLDCKLVGDMRIEPITDGIRLEVEPHPGYVLALQVQRLLAEVRRLEWDKNAYRSAYNPNDPRHNWTPADWERVARKELEGA